MYILTDKTACSMPTPVQLFGTGSLRRIFDRSSKPFPLSQKSFALSAARYGIVFRVFSFFFLFFFFWDLYPVCPRLKYRCNNLSQSALTTTLWRTRHHDKYSSPGRLAFSFNRRELFWATCSVRWNRMSQSIWTKLHGGARVNGTMWLTVLRSRNSRD